MPLDEYINKNKSKNKDQDQIEYSRAYSKSELIGRPPKKRKDKSVVIAYLLALTMGLAGGHRFYLGHFLFGFLYLFSFGGFGIGLVIDLLYLNRIVTKTNSKIRNEPEEKLIDESNIKTDPSLNPLQSSFLLWRWTKYIFFTFVMCITPYLYYDFFGDPTFSVIIFLLYFVVVFNKKIASIARNRNFFIWKIPGTRTRLLTIVNGFAYLRRYYATHPSSGWFRSIFSIFMLPFSKKVRREWKLFNNLLAFGMIFFIIQLAGWIKEYFTLYLPELGLEDLLIIKFALLVTSAFFTLMLLIPVVRTLTYIELAGDLNKGRGLVLFAAIVAIGFPFMSVIETYPYEHYDRLTVRIEKSKEFNKYFTPLADNFIAASFQPDEFSETVKDDGKEQIEYRLKHSLLSIKTSIQLTREFRQLLLKKEIVNRLEVNGFRVLAFYKKVDGILQPGLLAYLGYGEDEQGEDRITVSNKSIKVFVWSKLRTKTRVITSYHFISNREVALMYRILLSRMDMMKMGDQLSPDFKMPN